MWQRWLALVGHTRAVRPVATLFDAALMMQAAEQR